MSHIVKRMFNIIKHWLNPYQTEFTNRLPQYTHYEVGDWTYGTPTILDWKDGTVLKIGKYCSIARDVKILVGGEHHFDWVTTYPFLELWKNNSSGEVGKTSCSKGDVVIMNDVWIGTEVLILSGVTIYNGAVVGAGSIVTKDVPPYSIVAGNPARMLRYRFEPVVIEQLQGIAWWDWEPEMVREAWPLLLSTDIHAFIDKYRIDSLETI